LLTRPVSLRERSVVRRVQDRLLDIRGKQSHSEKLRDPGSREIQPFGYLGPVLDLAPVDGPLDLVRELSIEPKKPAPIDLLQLESRIGLLRESLAN
jgi:hypothetical protein